MKEILTRINELANKAKTEDLTEEEKKEQKILREEYLKRFRARMDKTLMGVKLVDEHGKDITPKKLKEAQRKNKEKEEKNK